MGNAWFENATRELSDRIDTAAAGRVDVPPMQDRSDVRVSNWTLACEHLQMDRWLQPERKAA